MRTTAPFVLALVSAAGLFGTTGRAAPAASPAFTARAGAAPADKAGPRAATDTRCDAVPVTGMATYFADAYHGHTMASGRPFNMDDPGVTAANRWPLGTRLSVRRIPGGPWDHTLSPDEHDALFDRTVIVTVQDRGRFDHALDLSRGAFVLLGLPREGVIRVQIQPLDC